MSSTSLWINETGPTFFDDAPPSCIDSAICPMSVFDKFGWCWDNDEMSDIMNGMNGAHDSEGDDSLLLNPKFDDDSEFSSLSSMFPDLPNDKISPLVDPLKSDPVCTSEFDPKIEVKEEPITTDELEAPTTLMPIPTFDEIKIETLDEAIKVVDSNTIPTTVTVPSTLCNTSALNSSVLSAPVVISTQPSTTPTVTTGSLIRIPVRRSPSGSVEPNFSKSGTSRSVKAVVVCPQRTKSILCNVVRATRGGLVIQAPRNPIHAAIATSAASLSVPTVSSVVSTISSIAKSERTKIPVMAVNVISSKEFKTRMAAIVAPEVKAEPTLAAINCTDNIKIEYEEVRPDIPLVQKSEEVYNSFSSTLPPTKCVAIKSECCGDPCLLDDDNFNSDSYRCMPPAVVTGQVQPSPTIPDVFKYTPNSSPTNNSELCLSNESTDAFPDKSSSNSSLFATDIVTHSIRTSTSNASVNNSPYYSKTIIDVDHDYGFTCRTPKSIFSADDLGIQTPSASEPPTDSDDDEDDKSDNFSILMNDDFDSSEMDRELEALKHEMRLAERDINLAESMKSSKGANTKSGASKKGVGRNRKRKAAKEHRNATAVGAPVTLVNRASTVFDLDRYATATPTTGTLKMRLPTKTASTSTSSPPPTKRRKNGSGGRIFSPSERHLHNTNEQVRRIEMRQSFEELRQLVPNLIDKPKAPKVLILQEAKAYCDELFHHDLRLSAQNQALACQQDRLKNTLAGLRKYCSDNVWSAVQRMF